MPTKGEIVLFDRSWYNRTGIAPGTDPPSRQRAGFSGPPDLDLGSGKRPGSAFNALEPL